MRIPTHGPPTHPGEMLHEEFLKPLGIIKTELARLIDVSYPRINELIHAKRGVTPNTALRPMASSSAAATRSSDSAGTRCSPASSVRS